ncbi:MAG: hypothetical protein H6732_00540 [Alphaproteobacteria bacterium]|nr:hypothetical protein [Alphaproteobacteria bacterium]
MASATKQTWFRRELRRKKAGAARKAHARNHGTTPPFDVRAPEALANAPVDQLTEAERAERQG